MGRRVTEHDSSLLMLGVHFLGSTNGFAERVKEALPNCPGSSLEWIVEVETGGWLQADHEQEFGVHSPEGTSPHQPGAWRTQASWDMLAESILPCKACEHPQETYMMIRCDQSCNDDPAVAGG